MNWLLLLGVVILAAVSLTGWFRAKRYAGMIQSLGTVLGAVAIEHSANGNLLVSSESLEKFVDQHRVSVTQLADGHTLVTATKQ